ncbi:MAG: leucine-rich repeat domain-containing protein, partial [Oscillospiraceae bacterium]|nr:leucine-rich repeat domain-containing protein [Oscillospiraceae bacterium]
MKKHNCRNLKLIAFLAAVTALSVLSGCTSAPVSVPEEDGTESVSSLENMSEDIPDNSEQGEDVSDIFTYRIKDGYVRINKYKGSETSVVIPDTIEGLPVKTINENAFYDLNITELTLPAGIENVSAKIINYSKELRNIYISEG